MSEEAQKKRIEEFERYLIGRSPNEPEFHQAVIEVVESVMPFISEHPKYEEQKILERIVEPERTIIFRVPWVNDNGVVEVNRGYRVQFSSAIGPYKGGIRFHPTVNMSILKFLGFEQIFKNALTTLPLGAAKGGADFNPRDRSDNEVMRFCQSYITEMAKHISADIDIPAGDIGVGAREIGYMFGQYKRMEKEFVGVMTGKGISWGGSHIRTEATGYGLVYFVNEQLKMRGEVFDGKSIVISGSGNVAQSAAEKAIRFGAKVVTMSDSDGFIYDEEGVTEEKLAYLKELKNIKRGRIKEYAQHFNVEYIVGGKPWGIPCDIALPCATQNELDIEGAKVLVGNGCIAVGEGANMPSTAEATKYFVESKILYAPSKAANAGGVATSGLEMSQNSLRLTWEPEEVDERLHKIMRDIHMKCVQYGKEEDDGVNYVRGANIAGFVRVADAMIDQGVV